MLGIIIGLIIILALLVSIIVLVLLCVKKVRAFLMQYFGTSSLKQAIENSKITDSETIKSVSSMESVYLNRIKEDFPILNLEELKSEAENSIRDVLNAIEKKDEKKLHIKNEKVTSYVVSKIEDLKGKDVSYDNIKFHKTVLNKYNVSSGIATIDFQSSLEYFYKLGSSIGRKEQTRFKTQFIYIVDPDQVEGRLKALGLNCPNCGAPIKTLGHKHCVYCDTGIVEIVKKSWNLNNIKDF